MNDKPLCGDPTCESPGCRQSAIDAWNEAREADARAIFQSMCLTPEQAYRDKDEQRRNA